MPLRPCCEENILFEDHEYGGLARGACSDCGAVYHVYTGRNANYRVKGRKGGGFRIEFKKDTLKKRGAQSESRKSAPSLTAAELSGKTPEQVMALLKAKGLVK